LTITGDDKLDRQLSQLESGATAVAEKATLAAAKHYEDAIRAAAPVGQPRKYKGRVIRPGALRKSIGRRRLVKTREGARGAKVGVNVVSRPGSNRRAPHGHLVTLGTQDRWTGTSTRRRRGGRIVTKITGNARRFRGRVTPRDFVRRGSAAAEPAANVTMARVVDEEVAKRMAAK
jgi:plasmid stabilization system protein ParE